MSGLPGTAAVSAPAESFKNCRLDTNMPVLSRQ
jgi:hypothetical protein